MTRALTSATGKTSANAFAPPVLTPAWTGVLQRKCDCGQHTAGGECEECKKKKTEEKSSGDPLLQRAALSRNPVNAVPGVVNTAMQQQGRTMEGGIRSRLESSFRCDLSRVRVHSDESAARAASAINARAFTLGQNIWFGRNEFAPHSAGGFHLLAHEVAHTIQQGAQTPVVQRSLPVGAVDDPAEAAAERAADAALRTASVPQLGNSQAVIRRAPTGFPLVEDSGPGLGRDKKRVSLDEHRRYIVKRTAVGTKRTKRIPTPPPDVEPGADFAKVWIQVEWCQDAVAGHAEVGLDVTQQLEALIPQVLGDVTANRGSNVATLLKNSTVTPYIRLFIARSGNWQFNANVHTDVGRAGVTSEGGSLQVSTSWGDISLDVTATQTPRGTDITGSLSWEIRFGKTTPTFSCKDKVNEWWEWSYAYECTKEKEPDTPKPPDKLDPLTRTVYFCYSTTELNDNKCAKSPADPHRKSYEKLARDYQKLNEETKEALKADFAKGYYVSEVVGHTSPEGPAGPRGTFEGNVPLAEDRAKAGLKFAIGPGREKGVNLRGGGSGKGPESDYPLFRIAEIRLAPPEKTKEPDAPTKPPDLNLPTDYLKCPPEVINLAFPKPSSKSKGQQSESKKP